MTEKKIYYFFDVQEAWEDENCKDLEEISKDPVWKKDMHPKYLVPRAAKERKIKILRWLATEKGHKKMVKKQMSLHGVHLDTVF